jgi:hypothetical protein
MRLTETLPRTITLGFGTVRLRGKFHSYGSDLWGTLQFEADTWKVKTN